MTPRVKPPHTLVSVLHWLWYCRATALSALANLTLLLGKNTLPFPAFGNLNFVSPPHRRACASIPKSCPNIRFPHQQDFFPIRSVTKSSTDENLVEKFKIFVQGFVPIIRTALTGSILEYKKKKRGSANNRVYSAALTSLLLFWCPCMVISVGVQCNGGLLPDIILLTLCDSIGEPF